ncbi:MAG: class I SAM-dependent methyltransferase [Candidatus Daviesbacteria bacterium]|nr:class I SAM-dependent methyltransferase [Candidatus Daviesbacteria bacterium]
MKRSQEELSFRLDQIKKVFNTNAIIHIQPTISLIANYYKLSKLAYSLFSNKNFIHMGISRNNKYSKQDLLEQVKLVDKYIKKVKAKRVLELATGRGANSEYLAKKYPGVVFEAIDLPDGQIDFALAKAKRLKNFHPQEGDYHDLSSYPNNNFDIVFIIEALCHSTNKKKVFSEVNRTLKNNGIFIIFDGYCSKRETLLTGEELLAKKLTEKGMAVPSFDYYQEFKNMLLKAKFKILEEEDASQLIMPTLEKFETQAKLYFKIPPSILKVINKFLPAPAINNVIPGYLMPILERLGITKYIILVVSKENNM